MLTSSHNRNNLFVSLGLSLLMDEMNWEKLAKLISGNSEEKEAKKLSRSFQKNSQYNEFKHANMIIGKSKRDLKSNLDQIIKIEDKNKDK